jgi:protein-S-isoprenylcysteine O-methyltransferase Ste14
MSHLSLAMRMGVPELSCAEGRQTLLRDGIYRVVRNPVYLTAAVAGVAFALVVNYLGVYILFVSAFPALYLITVLEEHELIERFGEEYRRDQREVPRLIPRWQKTAKEVGLKTIRARNHAVSPVWGPVKVPSHGNTK